MKGSVIRARLRDARKMFDELPHRDAISGTNIISAYAKDYDASEALFLFSRMWVEPNIQTDPFILNLALRARAANMNGKYGESLDGYSMKTEFVNSIFVGSALLDMYFKVCKDWEGCRVFDEMSRRNVVSWTPIITRLVHAEFNMEGLIAFSEMQK